MLAQHDAGQPCSQTVPEVAQLAQRLADINEEMHMVTCHHFSSSLEAHRWTYVSCPSSSQCLLCTPAVCLHRFPVSTQTTHSLRPCLKRPAMHGSYWLLRTRASKILPTHGMVVEAPWI